MRTAVSPSFTSSKMKMMFSLVQEYAGNFTRYFQEAINSSDHKDTIEIEMKDIFTRYTNDVIATAGFGINCNSLRDKNNEFFKAGKKATNINGLRNMVKLILLGSFLKLTKVS